METINLRIKNQNDEILVCEINKSENLESLKRPSILILHALTGKKENKTINFLAKNLPRYGYDTIQFDFSGHGESEGKLEEATVTKQLKDITSILQNISQVNTKKVIIIGNSFSVITALAFSKTNKCVTGLILLSGRANYLNYIETLEKVNDKYCLINNVLVDSLFINDYKKYNPLENIKIFANPILIIHGEKDKVVPKEDANLLYSSSDSSKKHLVIIKDAGHKYEKIEQKKEVLESIIQFLNKYF